MVGLSQVVWAVTFRHFRRSARAQSGGQGRHRGKAGRDLEIPQFALVRWRFGAGARMTFRIFR
jgi:hypothetical protein